MGKRTKMTRLSPATWIAASLILLYSYETQLIAGCSISCPPNEEVCLCPDDSPKASSTCPRYCSVEGQCKPEENGCYEKDEPDETTTYRLTTTDALTDAPTEALTDFPTPSPTDVSTPSSSSRPTTTTSGPKLTTTPTDTCATLPTDTSP